MAKQLISSKRALIDKANASVVAYLAVTSFIVVFSLVSSKALLNQRAYQSRVIKAKKAALKQLQANNKAAVALVNSYKAFIATPDNIIGGNPTGSGDRDGDNARIVLDALPSKYDFPALAASLEKIFANKNYKVNTITGIDDELSQSASAKTVQEVEMPFQVSITGNTGSAQTFLDMLQRSIRPFNVKRIDLSGDDSNLNVTISAASYYQPEKGIKITTKVIK